MNTDTQKNKERNLDIFNKYQKGASLVKLAKQYSLSRQRIYQLVDKLAKKTKQDKRKRIHSRSKKKLILRPNLLEDYRLRKKTIGEIAKTIGCHRGTIGQKIKGTVRTPSGECKSSLLYKDYKNGIPVKELVDKYQMTKNAVYVIVHYQRLKDPHPYYRYQGSKN